MKIDEIFLQWYGILLVGYRGKSRQIVTTTENFKKYQFYGVWGEFLCNDVVKVNFELHS